jgi:hypothetical protein
MWVTLEATIEEGNPTVGYIMLCVKVATVERIQKLQDPYFSCISFTILKYFSKKSSYHFSKHFISREINLVSK